MPLEMAGRDEALPAQGASVTPLSGVDEKVDPQVVGLGKAFPAVGAGVGSVLGVQPMM